MLVSIYICIFYSHEISKVKIVNDYQTMLKECYYSNLVYKIFYDEKRKLKSVKEMGK